MTARLEEPVRLPGMISMDLEHETLRTRGVTVPLQVGGSLGMAWSLVCLKDGINSHQYSTTHQYEDGMESRLS